MRWFQERLYSDHSQMLAVERVLHEGRTAFQEILLFENQTFGKVLVLDGVVQLTERDNHIYHEMLAHVPLQAHGAPREVLIIGGGDGGTLKEVLKHPVTKAVMVELDRDVIEFSRRFLPDVSGGAFDDPRADVIVSDGTRYVAETDQMFDAILIDSTDPIGPGEPLFTAAFYADCRRRLRPGGMMAVQSGAPFFQRKELDQVCGRLGKSFGGVRPFLAPVPTYAGGMLALVAAGDTADALTPPEEVLRERYAAIESKTRYYTPAIHRAAFVLPPTFEPKPEA